MKILIKKILLSISLLMLIIACQQKSKIEKQVQEISISSKIVRFDQLFFETPIAHFPQLKKRFPAFFPPQVSDSVWINKINHPQWRELYNEVESKYRNFDSQKSKLDDLFKHIQFYFPKTKTPKIVTLIYEMDPQTKAIYADSLVIIPLEMYLGKNHKFYEVPEYQKQNFEEDQILPDLVSSFAQSKIPPTSNKTFISMMVQAGKELYIKDLLLPNVTDAQKIGYTPEQLTFCEENQTYMWQYFVENRLLFNTDPKLAGRFINPAPFSKFYLEIDNDTPGRVGAWVGWQIVRSFMKNNDINMNQLLLMDATEIFNKSKFKPKKDV